MALLDQLIIQVDAESTLSPEREIARATVHSHPGPVKFYRNRLARRSHEISLKTRKVSRDSRTNGSATDVHSAIFRDRNHGYTQG